MNTTAQATQNITGFAHNTGMKGNVAISQAAWQKLILPTAYDSSNGQTIDGRLYTVLQSLKRTVMFQKPQERDLLFTASLVTYGKSWPEKFKANITKERLLIMLPHEEQ